MTIDIDNQLTIVIYIWLHLIVYFHKITHHIQYVSERFTAGRKREDSSPTRRALLGYCECFVGRLVAARRWPFASERPTLAQECAILGRHECRADIRDAAAAAKGRAVLGRVQRAAVIFPAATEADTKQMPRKAILGLRIRENWLWNIAKLIHLLCTGQNIDWSF